MIIAMTSAVSDQNVGLATAALGATIAHLGARVAVVDLGWTSGASAWLRADRLPSPDWIDVERGLALPEHLFRASVVPRLTLVNSRVAARTGVFWPIFNPDSRGEFEPRAWLPRTPSDDVETSLISALEAIIEAARQHAEIVLIDCPGRICGASLAAIRVADVVLSPTRLEWRAVHAVGQFVDTIARVRGDHGGDISRWLGLLPIETDPRNDRGGLTPHGCLGEREFETALRQRVGEEHVWQTRLRRSDAIGLAAGIGKSVLEYVPSSRVADDMRKLVLELARRTRPFGVLPVGLDDPRLQLKAVEDVRSRPGPAQARSARARLWRCNE